MIVRERENDYVLIEQDNHAQISGELIAVWKDAYFAGGAFRESAEYAIRHHDAGWKPLDQSPFWNDKKRMPYTFTDLPNPPKTVFYRDGINAVEKADHYAALLCSKHYTGFLSYDYSPEATNFVQTEEARRKRLIDSLPSFDDKLFQFHYGLLKLCDNLSLYICLNEPGADKEAEHPFFKNGIPLAKDLHVYQENKMDIQWIDAETVAISECPFNNPLTVTIRQKVIAKETIAAKGLLDSYQEAPYEDVHVRFVQK